MTMSSTPSDTVGGWVRYVIMLLLIIGLLAGLQACATPSPPPPPATIEPEFAATGTRVADKLMPTMTSEVTPIPLVTVTATLSVSVTPTALVPVPTTAAPPVTATRAAVATMAASVTPSPVASTATVSVTTQSITIAAYPYRAFQHNVTDPVYNWTWPMLDRAAYLASQPQPTPQAYRQLVMQNAYLRVSVLPELGGRLYELIYKPSGHDLLYKNAVLKPSPWGPPPQDGLEAGWLAAGGMEWGLPVANHGYAWGTPWGYDSLHFSNEEATLTVFQQPKGRLQVSTDMSLLADEAALTLRTRLTNPTDQAVDFTYWLNAMVAPGGQNRPSAALHFILPANEVTIHSTGDPDLPGAGQPMSWPIYQGRDLSRLANWRQYLGFFARPAVQDGFMGVYDTQADEGLVRVFPPDVMPGAKLFGLGGSDPIAPATYTDDSSAYVEMHGGLAPTFDDTVRLGAEGSLYWEETWYPVAGIGDVVYADATGALNLQKTDAGMQVNFYPIRHVSGELALTVAGTAVNTQPVDLQPAQPFKLAIPLPPDLPNRGVVSIQILDDEGQPVFQYQQEMALR